VAEFPDKSPPAIPTYVDQLLRESERDIPVTLPPATILIEAVKDLQSTIDGLEARIFALENP
jgi:hypothetical protein